MLFRPPKPAGIILNLAPMVDVMMCLIIFFLLASRLVDAQHHPLNLPYAETALEVERGELGRRVVINVRQSGDDPRVAEYVVETWDGRSITERRLAPTEVADYLQAGADRAREAQAELSCVIRADQNVSYAQVETVLRGCGLAKIARVVFSARVGEEPEDDS